MNAHADKLFTQKIHTADGTITIHAFDANRTDPQTGHSYIEIEVRYGGKVVFTRRSLWCGVNRWTAIDSNAAKSAVLATVALKPGDTDEEYFSEYTPEQLAFAEKFGEEISMVREARYGDM